MSLTDVLLLLFVIAKSSDKIMGRRGDLLVEAWPAIMKADWKGSHISGLACKEEIRTSRPLGVKAVNSETKLSMWDMPSAWPASVGARPVRVMSG